MRSDDLEPPAGQARAHALFVGELDVAARIAPELAAAGIAIRRFDPASVPAGPTVLIGHGAVGAAVLAAAERLPDVRAVVTVGVPYGPVAVGGAALLVLHSPVDGVVGVENARRIFDAARHPKSFVSLDGADHLLGAPADAGFAATMIATWAARYLPEAAPTKEGSVVVAETGGGTYRQRITAGRHVLTADEPRPVGEDTGPSPYDLLLAGLGACTSMTLRMYARRKKLPLEKVTVRLRHSRIHAEDCAHCETRVGRVDRIERSIRLDGDLDDDQLAHLLEIADKCPVHRTLHSEIDITTALEP
ncbi:OsmC family protein [Actinophytocola sp.]|uniref:bifunctional alpha/beta hydrolase/OsmC family protein n=1 Tax=Actinophytocola sp. TaxID=1872138 RepID=UPI0025BF50E6|nr:OsmC family protein [Actinophytocola sp.]